MQKQEALNYEEQYKDALVQFSPFAFTNTGIIKSQTQIKIDTYTLVSVPWQLSMKRAVLLGSFSKDEIVFFQRYKGTLAALTITVQRPDAREPMNIFSRCQIVAVGQMKEKEGVGLIALDWKPLPPSLAEILGEYLMLVDRLKVEWDDFKDKSVSISPENAKRLGYNNYAVLRAAGEQHKIALFAIAANRLDFLMPMRAPDQEVGLKIGFDLFFLKYRFSVQGVIESSSRLPTGVQRLKANISFSPELVHILEEYFYSHP
jgi:hypothetical protein